MLPSFSIQIDIPCVGMLCRTRRSLAGACKSITLFMSFISPENPGGGTFTSFGDANLSTLIDSQGCNAPSSRRIQPSLRQHLIVLVKLPLCLRSSLRRGTICSSKVSLFGLSSARLDNVLCSRRPTAPNGAMDTENELYVTAITRDQGDARATHSYNSSIEWLHLRFVHFAKKSVAKVCSGRGCNGRADLHRSIPSII